MGQWISTARRINIFDQAVAAFIAILVYEVAKHHFFRYIWKPKQDDKKNHCDVFTQKLQDIQDDQKSQSIQLEKQLNNFSSLLNKVRQEQMSGRKQIDNHHHHTSPDLSHPQRPSTQASASSERQLNIAPNRQVWDLNESTTAEVPPGATHGILSWIFSPRTSPVLQQAQSAQHDETLPGARRTRVHANFIEGETSAGPSSEADLTAQSAEEEFGVPEDLGITMSDEEAMDDLEKSFEDASSEEDTASQSGNQVVPPPQISTNVAPSGAVRSRPLWSRRMPGVPRGHQRAQQ